VSDADWSADLSDALLRGDAEQARALTERALAAGVRPEQLLDDGLIPAIAEAGRRFEDQRFFLPELMLAARATKEALALIKPLLAERDVPPAGRVVIGTVAGDLHDIGKNIVAAMLEGGGFAVYDLGIDVAPAAFAAAALEHDADIIGLSALLTTTMPVMREVVAELSRVGARERVKVLVGGAPLTAAYAAEIGADAYAATAAQAVAAAHDLLTRAGPVEHAPPDLAAKKQPGDSVGVASSPSAARRVAAASVTPREVVKQTLEFQGPSRLPRQLWLLPWASKRYPEDVDRLERDFPSDIVVIPIFSSEPVPGGGNAHAVGTFVDAWGCTFENLQEGIIGQVKRPRVTDWSETEHVRFPRERLAVDREQVNKFCRQTDRFVLAGTCPRPFERLQFLRGPENLYLDLNHPSADLRAFLERLHAFYVEELKIWAATEVDALTFMDDWGSQRSLLVAPDLFRELFKPLYADYISIAHEHGKYAFMHSDGHIAEIVPDLIEIGLDALNSQVFCMDIEDLGERFAGGLTFWGELDRQQLLPRASTAQIAEAAKRLQAAFHREGGFIAQCEFGPGARPENVYAFFAACAGG